MPTGGAYDGAYGVAAALCALELLDARNVRTEHPIEAVAWAGEEGSRFPLGCLGSAVFAGLADEATVRALVGDDGVVYADALASPDGGLLAGVPMRDGRDVAAYVELHVEQGPVLEQLGAFAWDRDGDRGAAALACSRAGRSGHAGTVPMAMRADALCAAAELVLAFEAAARDVGDAVATVGRMVVEPNGTNVIPADVTFSLDLRSPDERNSMRSLGECTARSTRWNRSAACALKSRCLRSAMQRR